MAATNQGLVQPDRRIGMAKQCAAGLLAALSGISSIAWGHGLGHAGPAVVPYRAARTAGTPVPSRLMVFASRGRTTVARLVPSRHGGSLRVVTFHQWDRSGTGAPDWYSWSSDGRHLLRAPFGDGYILVYRANLHLTDGAALRRVDGYGAEWAPGVQRVAYQALGAKNQQVFRGLTPRGGSFSIWPHRQSAGPLEAIEVWGTRQFADPAEQAWVRDTQTWSPTVYWIARHNLLLYEHAGSMCDPATLAGRCTWWALSTTSGVRTQLPYLDVTVSPDGAVAGTLGARVVVRPSLGSRPSYAAVGYAPAWSPTGSWMYYVTSHRLGSYRLRLPDGRGHARSWSTVTSAFSTQTVWRVRPDGSGLQRIVSRVAYRLANLSVLSDGDVVFDDVPTDRQLWLHRKHLTRALVRRYAPVVNIEMGVPGGKLQVLTRRGERPAVQP